MDTASDKALQRFAELMIEKIKQVEDNWQKPWFEMCIRDRDKAMNTYHITIKRGNTSVFTYNFDDQRKYTAHVDVNSEEMERCIQELRTKKRNICSLGVIENKFELSMALSLIHI